MSALSTIRASAKRARTATPAGGPDGPAGMTPRRCAILIGLWLGLAALIILIQLGRRSPTVYADELIYGRLAQNIGFGEGRTFQGLSSGQRTLYPYLIAPAWALFDHMAAYRVALGINALVMTSAMFPAFALARRVASFPHAVGAACCAVLVPSMVWAGMLMTEALAYPLAALSLLLMVHALRRPSALAALAVALAIGAAYFARTQLIVLAVVFGGAVMLDLLRFAGTDIRGRARRHGAVLAAGALALIGAVVALAAGRAATFGGYACVVAEPPTPGELAGPISGYVGIIMVSALVLPVIAVVALAARRANWRDDGVGPLLCVGVAAVLGFIGEAAWVAVTASPELQERYVFYVAPVLIACLVVLPSHASIRTIGLVTVGLAIYSVVLFPGFADVSGDVVADRLGLGHPLADLLSRQEIVWALITAALGGAGVVAARMGGARSVTLVLATTAVFGLAVLGVRQLDANRQSQAVAGEYQQPLDVVDRRADGPAAVIVSAGVGFEPLFHLQMWNRSIDRIYRVGIADAFGVGQLCPLDAAADGALNLRRPCAGRELPTTVVFLDGKLRLPLANGQELYERQGMRVIRYAAGEPTRLAVSPVARANLKTPPDAPPAPQSGLQRCNA